ncbi:MAG: ester cyclase [Flavobacterium sp.]
MKNLISNFSLLLLLLAISSCFGNKEDKAQDIALKAFQSDKLHSDSLLIKFDSLDFDVYSNQKWNHLNHSHADNILVHYPDGHTTKGIPAHIEELKPMFVFAPDTKIKKHPVRIAADNWTSVIGEMEGTFSSPMPIGNGKTIPPTGKKFRFQMVTVGHWANGKMDEEYLFWDNYSFMKQIGLAL